MERPCPFEPPAQYGRLRAESPIARVLLPTGSTAWAVASHAHVRALLADPRVSIQRDKPGFPDFVDFGADDTVTDSLMSEDPPRHTELRRMVIAEFTMKRIRAMRPAIQRMVDQHIDQVLAGEPPVDLVEALALPIPSLVICELLGVPYEDHEFFQERTRVGLILTTSAEVRAKARLDLVAYMDDLVHRAEADPGEDLIGRLIVKSRAEGDYDHDTVRDLARLLLVAGHETPASMISLGILALLRDPGLRERLSADPSLWPQTVEELLRYFSAADFVPCRVALADIEIGGVTIAEGEGVILLTASANRDATVFENPDEVDIDTSARHHVAFGYGVHQCLGQNLARHQLEIVYRSLFERVPGLKLAVPVDELPYRGDSFVHSVTSLPVTW